MINQYVSGTALTLGLRRVWRESTPAPIRWGKMSRAQRARRYANAEAFDRKTKRHGKHGGAIGHTALKVFHTLLFGFFNTQTGRLDPSYDAIAKRANLSRKAVWAALKRLMALGMLNWTRRCSITKDDTGRPVLRQSSNAYLVADESCWKGFVPPPLPSLSREDLGAPEAVLNGLEQYDADLRMGLSSQAALQALERVAASRLETVLAGLGAKIHRPNPV